MGALVHQIGDCNHRQWKCAQNIVSFGWEAGREDIPSKKDPDAEECKNAENDGRRPVSAIETSIH
jgi:hypothetical protein